MPIFIKNKNEMRLHTLLAVAALFAATALHAQGVNVQKLDDEKYTVTNGDVTLVVDAVSVHPADSTLLSTAGTYFYNFIWNNLLSFIINTHHLNITATEDKTLTILAWIVFALYRVECLAKAISLCLLLSRSPGYLVVAILCCIAQHSLHG